jgi:chemotaxis protein CheZ
MTEGLRKALRDLEGDVGVAGMTLHEIPDVRDRLQYIIAKTERAAHRTIGSVEALLPMVKRISGGAEKLIEDWSRIEWEGLDSTNLSALRDRVIEVVGQLRGDARALHDRLCEILVAQDYQDLIGQVIQRVVQLLQEVEAKLATIASLSGGIAKEAPAHGDEAEPEGSDEQSREKWTSCSRRWGASAP